MMPGIVTHYAFGREVYRELAGVIRLGKLERESFLLGNLGPDPFLYIDAVLPKGHRLRGIGSAMHKQNTERLLTAVHEALVVADGGDAGDAGARAFALGFLCHYFLDSAVHPLVLARQSAICAQGGGGLSRKGMRRAVHATIETELDEYVYTTKLDTGVRSLPPHREMLRCPFAVVAGVSGQMAAVIRGVYGVDVPDSLFLQAVQVFRLAQTAIDSKSCGLRRRVDYLRPLGLSSAYVNALSHVDSPRSFTPFANEEHTPWPSAFEGGACVCEDFEGLYRSAFQRALSWLPRFAGGDFGEADCRVMVGGVDFRGKGGISFLDTFPKGAC